MTPLSTPAAQGTVAFERWAEPSGYRLRLYDGEETGRRYYYLSTERVWLAWCAASPSPEALPASGVEAARIALERIARWVGEFPETGQFWDTANTEPMSYAACFGSNGERDFMRSIAREALAALTSAPAPEDRT
jgi:hypothetical protein